MTPLTDIEREQLQRLIISKQNLSLLQQAFGPMFGELDKEYPRMSQAAGKLIKVNLAEIPRQSFSENTLKQDGALYVVKGEHGIDVEGV
jgi:hypothetical protein